MAKNFEPQKSKVGYHGNDIVVSLTTPARRVVRDPARVVSAYELIFVAGLIALYVWAGG